MIEILKKGEPITAQKLVFILLNMIHNKEFRDDVKEYFWFSEKYEKTL